MEKIKRIFSLVFVREQSRILLGLKKRGFGQGKWNGFGGKIEARENIREGAVRELKEECGLFSSELKYIGVLEYTFEENSTIMIVHVFETWKYSGEVTESEEMLPKWYNLKDIPFDVMWMDDSLWYPYMLRGELFKGNFLFRGDTLVLGKVCTVDKLSEEHV